MHIRLKAEEAHEKGQLTMELVQGVLRRRAGDVQRIEEKRAATKSSSHQNSNNRRFGNKNTGTSRASDTASVKRTHMKKIDVRTVHKDPPEHWKSMECYHCGQSGHPGRFCLKRQCHWCQEFGHLSHDCPDKAAGKPSKNPNSAGFKKTETENGKKGVTQDADGLSETSAEEAVYKKTSTKPKQRKRCQHHDHCVVFQLDSAATAHCVPSAE